MKMTMVNISDAKARFSEFTRRVKKGERIILCDRNKPFAEIRPLNLSADGRRPFGLAKGRIHIPVDINKPDSSIEALFSGEKDK